MSTDGFEDEQSTLAHPRFNPTAASDAGFSISVLEGPDHGRRLVVNGDSPPVWVGTSPACALQLSDRTVSRRHLSLEVRQTRLCLKDLGSKNGTSVNGVSVGEAFLLGGEQVRLGATTLGFERVKAQVTPLAEATSFGRVLGASREMRRLYPLLERIARADAPVLIEGETGTGKEALAESLHEQGPRRDKPFVVFDCTAVAPTLLEAELFGHERGAFTGAVGSRPGVFEQAHTGTLFIDEIGDLEPSLQPKLLRALERSEVRRVGGDKVLNIDVRIIAATRRNLDAEVEAGRFRDDLFHRLAVLRVTLPPLRERKGDVVVLAQAFCQALGAGPGAIPGLQLSRWERHSWPGNVRELRNAVARYLTVGEAAPSVAGSSDEGDLVDRVLGESLPFARARERVIEEFERRFVQQALEAHGGNVSRAAAASGIARRYFQILKARLR